MLVFIYQFQVVYIIYCILFIDKEKKNHQKLSFLGVIDCDGFVCPPTSYKCAVIEKSGVIPHWHSSYSTLSLSDTVRLNDKIITTRSCSDSMGNYFFNALKFIQYVTYDEICIF